MDDSSPTARENRPAHRPPAPPAVAFDNHAYQPDEQQDGGPARQNDANHNLTQQNESFGANGDVKSDNDTNNDRKEPYEAVNLELINLAPKNGSAAKEAAPKKEVEVDMNSSNPYDEYFVPVNEHKKYIRGEKLYVTADKRNKGGNRRPLCWTVGILLLLGAILIAVLAATGVIFTSTATPVNQYNSSLSTARALGGLSGALEHGEHGEHGHEQVSEHSAPETSTDGALDYTMADVPDDSLYVPRTVEGELKIDNEDFKPELSDEFSEPHREFTGTLARALARALFPPDGRRADSDVRVSILNLNPGSVVVTYRIHWIPKSNVQNATDSISSENLNTKLSDYLQSNHRMLNIYHVSEDGLKARRVLDRCQNDMNGCESGCEFDNVMLDFKCTCPSNKVPDMKNPKKCVYPMDNSLYAHLPITSEKTNEGDYRVLNISEENSQPSISPQDKAETDVVIDSSDIFDWMNSQTPKTEQTTENMLDIKNSHIFGNPKDDLLVDPISNINLEDSSEEPSATHRSILMHEPPAEPAAEPEPEPSAEPNPSPKPEPAAEPEPEPAAEPEPEPAAEPEPEPAAEPEPGPAAVPEPEPTHSSNDDIDEHVTSLAKSVFPVKENLVPRPVQTSTKVESEPKPEPEPTIQLQPEPTSQPEPEPTSEPQQQQSEPRPTIQPQPEPINEPQSVLQPQSKPTSELQGEPDNKAKVTINTYNSKSSDELQSVIQKSISEEIINASTESVLMPYPESSSKTPFVEDLNNESSRMSKTNHVQQLDESISHDEKNHVTSSAIVQINNNFTTAIKSIEPVDSSKEIAFSSSENTTDEANYREYMGEEYEVEDVVTEASKNKGIRENNYIPNENFFSNVKEEITQPTLAEEVNEDTTEIDLTTHTNSQSDVNNDSTEPPVRLLEQQQNRFTSTSGEENEDSKNESLTMKEKLEGKEYSTDIINKSTNSSETMSVEDLNERSKKTISADSKEITFDAIQEITSTLTVNPENTTISETTEIENESTTSRTIINSEMPDPNPKLVNLLDESSTTEHSNLDWLSSVIDQENETIESSTHLIMLESNEDSTDKPEDSYDPAKANDDHSEKKESDEDTESNEDDNGTDSDYLSNAALEGQDVPQYGLLTDYDSASYRDKRLQTTSMKTETTSEPTKPNITDKMLADYIYNSANRSRESSESEELELNASNAMAEEQEMNMQLDNSGKEPAPVWEHDEIEPEQVFYNEGANSTESETVAENKTTANQHNNIIPLPVAPFSNYSQSNNLNVTVYEVPGNTTKTLKVESITHSADVEEHESEMNPFLPEIDNNKYLVKKLQEGHDLDPTNVNEKQNEHSDELPIVESQMTKHKTQVQNVTDTSLKSDEDITDTTEVAVTTHSVGPNLDERLKEHKIEDSTDSSDELDKMLEEREQLISAKPAVGNSKITRDGSSKLVSSSFIDDISDLLSSKEGSGSDEAMMVSTVSDSDVNFLDMLSTTTQPFSQSNGLLETELKTNAPVEDQHFSEAHFSANEDGILSVLPIKPAKKSDKKPTNDYFQKKNEKNAKLQENNVNDISDYSDRNQRTLDVTNYQSE